MFEPFLGEDSYAYSDSDESEDDASSQNALKPHLDKGKGKLGETLEKPLKSTPDKPTTSLKQSKPRQLQTNSSIGEATVEVGTQTRKARTLK